MPRPSGKVFLKLFKNFLFLLLLLKLPLLEEDDFQYGRVRTSEICSSIEAIRTLIKIVKINFFKTPKLNQRLPKIQGVFIQEN